MRKYLVALGFILLFSACGGGSSNEAPSDTNQNSSPNNPDSTMASNDAQKPVGNLSINDHAPTSTSHWVSLQIHGEDNNRIVGYFLSSDNSAPDAHAAGWVPVVSETSSLDITVNDYLLVGGGTKGLFLWLKDAAGNVSDAAFASIDLWSFHDLSEFCADPTSVDIALDSQNKSHIVCRNNNNVFYITNQSGAWARDILSSGAIYDTSPSLVIDSHEGLHVIFNSGYLQLGAIPTGIISYYYKPAGSTWRGSIITTGPPYSIYIGNTSLSIDEADHLHLLSFLKTTIPSTVRTLQYWNNTSGPWVSDASLAPFSFPNDEPQADLTLDNQGSPRVCYGQSGRLVYGKKNGGGWDRVSNSLIGDGINCSIVTNNNGYSWIAYHNSRNALNVLTFDVSPEGPLNDHNYSVLYTDSSVQVGKNISETTDGEKIYLGYFDGINNALYYAQQIGPENDSWFMLLLDSSGIQDIFPLKIAVDSDKKLHLLYYKAPGAKLMYATTR